MLHACQHVVVVIMVDVQLFCPPPPPKLLTTATTIVTCFIVFIPRFTLQTQISLIPHFRSRVIGTEPHFHFGIMSAFLNFE